MKTKKYIVTNGGALNGHVFEGIAKGNTVINAEARTQVFRANMVEEFAVNSKHATLRLMHLADVNKEELAKAMGVGVWQIYRYTSGESDGLRFSAFTKACLNLNVRMFDVFSHFELLRLGKMDAI